MRLFVTIYIEIALSFCGSCEDFVVNACSVNVSKGNTLRLYDISYAPCASNEKFSAMYHSIDRCSQRTCRIEDV